MALLELRDSIPVTTPLGDGYAIILETGPQDHFWTVVLNNCAIVTFTQDRILVKRSYTHRRSVSDDQMTSILDRVTHGNDKGR